MQGKLDIPSIQVTADVLLRLHYSCELDRRFLDGSSLLLDGRGFQGFTFKKMAAKK